MKLKKKYVNLKNKRKQFTMHKLLILLLPLLISCTAKPTNTSDFDAYLDKLMAEPYNPIAGSKY